MNDFDLIVIGGGPGGYLSAERGGSAGLRVLLIEKNKLGGVCLNEGCIPTKTLLYSAKILDNIKNGGAYGVRADNITFDHKTVLTRKAKAIRRLGLGIKATLKNAGVTTVSGQGKILKKEGDKYLVEAGDSVFSAPKLIIATGSHPFLPPIKGCEQAINSGFALTSKEILEITDIPENLTVVGGGVIGLEMALYFSVAGSKVTVVEYLDKIGGEIEEEIATALLKSMSKRGITFHLQSKVVEITENSIIMEKEGETLEISAGKVLLSTGRVPNTDDLGLENIGIEVGKKREIPTNSKGETTAKGVYAVGDVNGKYMLAHTAYREGEVAINNILGKDDTVNYQSIPSVIYTFPEVAGVGESEQSAVDKGYQIKIAKLPFTYSGRFVAEATDLEGMIKIIADKKANTLIGVHMLGSYASEFIIQATTLIESQMDIEQIKKIVYPHPTVSEMIREAVFAL